MTRSPTTIFSATQYGEVRCQGNGWPKTRDQTPFPDGLVIGQVAAGDGFVCGIVLADGSVRCKGDGQPETPTQNYKGTDADSIVKTITLTGEFGGEGGQIQGTFGGGGKKARKDETQTLSQHALARTELIKSTSLSPSYPYHSSLTPISLIPHPRSPRSSPPFPRNLVQSCAGRIVHRRDQH